MAGFFYFYFKSEHLSPEGRLRLGGGMADVGTRGFG